MKNEPKTLEPNRWRLVYQHENATEGETETGREPTVCQAFFIQIKQPIREKVMKMSLVKWNPLREMEAMHSEMNRLFSRMNSGGGAAFGEGASSSWMLPVDVLETRDALKLRAALPGVNPQDVHIQVEDNVLSITFERRFEDKLDEGGYHWVEQQYGTFSRAITLPRYADTEKIEARTHNGVLELLIPKKDSAKPRRIEVQPAPEPKAFDGKSSAPTPELSAAQS